MVGIEDRSRRSSLSEGLIDKNGLLYPSPQGGDKLRPYILLLHFKNLRFILNKKRRTNEKKL